MSGSTPMRVTLQTRLTIAFTVMACGLISLTTAVFYQESNKILRSELRKDLTSTAVLCASQIDGMDLAGLKSEQDPGYKRIQDWLASVKAANPDVRYIYTMRVDQKGAWYFGVDATKAGENGHSALGEYYKASNSVVLMQGVQRPIADTEFSVDSYGTWLSGYAPVLDHGKLSRQLVGVDMSADLVRHQEGRLLTLALLILLGGFGGALAIGWALARLTTGPVSQLVEGTRKVSAGDLETRVPDHRQDELGDLARSFNGMIAAISSQREELKETERMSQELATARKIQQAMLPASAPYNARLNIDFYLETSTEVGGDYFDFLPLIDHQLAMVIGDVTGHGVPAALLMAVIKSCLHTQVLTNHGVADVMAIANSILHESRFERRFMTFFYSILDTESGKLTYANAGHPYPFLYRMATGKVEALEMASYPLGVRPILRVEEQEATLEPGDVLVFYSDGIIEAQNEAGEEFGFDRLENLVAENGHGRAEDLKEKILSVWRHFVYDGTAPLDFHATKTSRADDDVTVVVVRYAPAKAATGPISLPANLI